MRNALWPRPTGLGGERRVHGEGPALHVISNSHLFDPEGAARATAMFVHHLAPRARTAKYTCNMLMDGVSPRQMRRDFGENDRIMSQIPVGARIAITNLSCVHRGFGASLAARKRRAVNARSERELRYGKERCFAKRRGRTIGSVRRGPFEQDGVALIGGALLEG